MAVSSYGSFSQAFINDLNSNFGALSDAIQPNPATVCATLVDLKALATRPDSVLVKGKTSPNDDWGGIFVWVAGDSTSADDALVVQCTSGPAGRYKRIYDGLADVRWWGVKADWTGGTNGTDNAAAFSAAFAAVTALDVPPGNYLLLSCPTPPTGSFHLRGVPGQTRLGIAHAASSGALSFTPASLGNPVTIEGLSLVANYDSGPCDFGIKVVYPSSSSFPFRTLTVRNITYEVDTSSTTTPWARTWKRGAYVENAWEALYQSITGYSYYNPGATDNSGFIEFAGGSYGSIAAEIVDVHWYYGASAIKYSAYTEGLFLSGCEFVGQTRGVYCPNTTPVGGAAGLYRFQGLYCENTHFQTWTAAFDLDTGTDLEALGLNVQRVTGSTANWAGYNLNAVLYPRVTAGTIAGNAGTGTATGIVATGVTAHGHLQGVHTENLDVQFDLGAATSLWTIRGNDSTGDTPDTWTDDGTNNVIQWRNQDGTVREYGGGSRVTVQSFTSGSGTYTTPSGARSIRVTLLGGGGGGSGSGSGSGSGANGGDTTFGSLTAAKGSGGVGGGPGGGGTGGGGTNGDINISGGTGGPGIGIADLYGGMGGASAFGGAGQAGYGASGVSGAGGNAAANSGSGGGGAGGGASSGTGGGAGAYLVKLISPPAISYSYGVGVGGAGGTTGSSGAAGGNGAAGIILVEEFYS